MLKPVLFIVLMASTLVRLADIAYLIANGRYNLPAAVIAVTAAIVVYGLLLILKKFVAGIRISELMAFYLVWAAAIVFNLSFLRISGFPFALTFPEFIAVGTFLDLVVVAFICYYGMKQMRRTSIPASMREGNMHV